MKMSPVKSYHGNLSCIVRIDELSRYSQMIVSVFLFPQNIKLRSYLKQFNHNLSFRWNVVSCDFAFPFG